MRIVLVRHAETDANAARVLQLPGAPLSKRGRWQASLLGQRLISEEISLILSSDFRRAATTARSIANATGAPIAYEPLLRERDFGAWRGVAYADLNQDPFNPESIPPGGESVEKFEQRVAEAFVSVERVAFSAGGSIVVVTHGLVCRAFVNRHFDPTGCGHPDRWDNTSITEVTGPPWRLVRVNCVAHLSGSIGGNTGPSY